MCNQNVEEINMQSKCLGNEKSFLQHFLALCLPYPRGEKRKGIEKEICFSCPRGREKEGHRGRNMSAMPKRKRKGRA